MRSFPPVFSVIVDLTGLAARELTQAEYDHAADMDMETLHENLETLCEVYGPDDWEVEYSVGRRIQSIENAHSLHSSSPARVYP